MTHTQESIAGLIERMYLLQPRLSFNGLKTREGRAFQEARDALSALSRRVEELEVALQVAYDYARLFNRPTDAAWNEAEKMILAALKEIPDAK